jgi:hypothetical protein
MCRSKTYKDIQKHEDASKQKHAGEQFCRWDVEEIDQKIPHLLLAISEYFSWC